MKKNNHLRQQRGVALLFSLAVLTLLLILGLASVTNALLAQKVAYNNSSRSQAKMLANSAISRMAISLMYYQNSASAAGVFPTSYQDVYSFYNLPDGETPNTSDKALGDGLRGVDSKLIPPGGLSDYDIASDLKGEWSYILSADSTGTKRIVGRVAYQLLPTSVSAQINLDHALRGVYLSGTPSRIPWDVRWGTDIGELNLENTTALQSWQASHAPASSTDLYASTFDAFFAAYATSMVNTDKKKVWIRRWFAEGTVPAEPECYQYDDTSTTPAKQYYRHRFNLSGTSWYDRLKTYNGTNWVAVPKNSDQAIEALADESEEFKITDTTTPSGVGLPFLKFITNDKGSFADLDVRRKQIAANLTDYSDDDSIPTADFSALNWLTNLKTASSWPNYTGNEETPYINELALGFKIKPSLVPGTGTFAGYDVHAKVELNEAELIAELIQIYENMPDTSNHKLHASLKSMKLQFKVSIKGELKHKTGTSPSVTEKISADITSPINVFDFDAALSSSPVVVDFVTAPAPSWNSGYLVHAGAIPMPTASEFEFPFTSEFQSKLPSGHTLESAEITEIKVEVINPQVTLQSIVLTGTTDVNGASTDNVGLDFVRWDNDGTTTLPRPQAETGVANELTLYSRNIPAGQVGVEGGAGYVTKAFLSGTAIDEFSRFYIGGMEVKDPRQNLNAKSGLDIAATDWNLFKDIALVDYDNPVTGSGKKKITINIVPSGTTIIDRLQAGLVNSDSSPKRESTPGIFDPNYDAETVLDPAWLGVNANQHMSTAFIRNSPMRSPWELGAIHRGAAWETINLKNAMKPGSTTDPIKPEHMGTASDWLQPGTTYIGGDGGLLEQIKMTDRAYSYGKLNLNMLSADTTINKDYTVEDDEMSRALFFNIRKGQQLYNFDTSTAEAIAWNDTTQVVTPMKEAVADARASSGYSTDAFNSRSQFLCWEDSSGNTIANGFGIIPLTDYELLSDAQQEELIGKTVNLLKATPSASNTIKFIVVAQTIRDLKGTIVRIDSGGNPQTNTTSAEYGVFDLATDNTDSAQYVYFDEIIGEVKMLVTMENNPTTGQTIVRQIEYIE